MRRLIPLLLLIGCPEVEPEPAWHLAFTQDADGAPVELGNDTPLHDAFGTPFGVTRLMYFLSDVELVGETPAPLADAHLVDVGEDVGLTLTPDLPPGPGPWDSLRFTFGLTAERNVDGAFPNRPESLMEWPQTLGGGYHYLRLEGRWTDGDTPRTYALHTGPLDGVDRSFTVELAGPFDADPEAPLILSMNVLGWLTGAHDVDLSDEALTGGIMHLDEQQQRLFENADDVWSVR